MSVSQSVSRRRLLCSMDQGNLMEKEMSINQFVLVSQETRTVLTASFLKNTQAEKVVDGSGKPDERNSSNAQIRTLLEEQRQMIIAEYREKIGHHELQAAHAEEERRLLREELWRQKLEFREVHQQSLTEMEELANSKVPPSIQSQDESLSRTRREHHFGIIRQSTRTTK